MKIISIIGVCVGLLLTSVVYAEELVVASTLEKSPFKPSVVAPKPIDRDFIAYLKTLKDYPGVIETAFTTSDLHAVCKKPRVISYNENDLHGAALTNDCFIFFQGDVQRLISPRADMEQVRYGATQFFIPRNAAMILLEGELKDSIPRGIITPPSAVCDRCATKDALTTCALKEAPAPLCTVVQYKAERASAVWGQTYGRSLSSCAWYAEGTGDISVSAEHCMIKAVGSGRINADCAARFAIDAREGDHTIFLGSGDGWVVGDSGDTIYATEAVNLLFIDNSAGPAKVIKPADQMPCMRIIKVP